MGDMLSRDQQQDGKKTKVVQVGPGVDLPGGMRTVMEDLRTSELAAEFGLEIVPTASKKHRIRTFMAGLHRVEKLVKQGECDAVHIHMSERASVFRAIAIIRRVKRMSDCKVIVHSHGGEIEDFFNSLSPRMQSYCFKGIGKADCLVALTPSWERWWNDLVPNIHTAVIPNCVAIPPVQPCKESGGDVILFLGCIGRRKGVDVLLEAACKVIENYPKTKFVFAGNGDVDGFKTYASDLGIASNCLFTGWVGEKEKKDLLSGSSVLVLPSRRESFGIALLEGMAYGLPVICSTGGNMKEIVDDGSDGIVFKSEDSDALADSILLLIKSKSMADAMGKRGRQKVERVYSKQVVMGEWSNLYRTLLT